MHPVARVLMQRGIILLTHGLMICGIVISMQMLPVNAIIIYLFKDFLGNSQNVLDISRTFWNFREIPI